MVQGNLKEDDAVASGSPNLLPSPTLQSTSIPTFPPHFIHELPQTASSPPADCEEASNYFFQTEVSSVMEAGSQRVSSRGLKRLWTEYFKKNPFGSALWKYRNEIPDENCLVWLDSEV